MNKVAIIIVSLILAMAVGLIGCATSKAPAPTPSPAQTYGPTSEWPTTVNLPVTDTFILAPADEEEAGPDLYVSSFFLVDINETVDILIKSKCPICVHRCVPSSELNEFCHEQKGILADLADGGVNIKSCDMQRVDNLWEARIIFVPGELNRYLLFLQNFTSEPAWCEYTISIR